MGAVRKPRTRALQSLLPQPRSRGAPRVRLADANVRFCPKVAVGENKNLQYPDKSERQEAPKSRCERPLSA
jgi:hypothetical protein